MNTHAVVGSLGVFLLLLAYLLNLVKVITPSSFWYGALNTVGGALATYSSYLLSFLPFIILEGTWTMVSMVSLIKYLRRNSREVKIFLIPGNKKAIKQDNLRCSRPERC